MDEIWLIRHGESESNAGLPTEYPQGTIITEKGGEQAKVVADYIPSVPDLIITSSFIRSIQTALPAIKRFPETPVVEWPVHEFTYLQPKKYYQTTVFDRKPLIEKFWAQGDPYFIDGDGAESFSIFTERVLHILNRLRELKGFVLVYSHGHVIRCLLWMLLFNLKSANEANMRVYSYLRTSLRVPNASILKLRFVGKDEICLSNFIVSHLSPGLLTGC